MKTPAPKTKERLALLRFEVVCHLKTLRQEGHLLAECVRRAASRPWPEPDGLYYSPRTLEGWWYDYGKSGYQGLAGKPGRGDGGKSRSIDDETGDWIIDKIRQNPTLPLEVLYRHWQDHGRGLPSISSVRRFLKTRGMDRRSLRADVRQKDGAIHWSVDQQGSIHAIPTQGCHKSRSAPMPMRTLPQALRAANARKVGPSWCSGKSHQ